MGVKCMPGVKFSYVTIYFPSVKILVIHSMYCSHHVSTVNWWFGTKLIITLPYP
jgi:hypothetical protein